MEDKERNKEQGHQIETVTDMVDINPTMSVIILNINGLSIPVKTDFSEWIRK